MQPSGLDLTLTALSQALQADSSSWTQQTQLRVQRVGGELLVVVDQLAREVLAATNRNAVFHRNQDQRLLLTRCRVEEPNAHRQCFNWWRAWRGDRLFAIETLANQVEVRQLLALEEQEAADRRLRTAQRRLAVQAKVVDRLNQWVAGAQGIEADHRLQLSRYLQSIMESPRGICLNLCGSHLRQLPPDLGNHLDIREIELRQCAELEELPESLSRLRSLRIFRLDHCPQLHRLPENLEFLRQAREVSISRCAALPDAELERLLAVTGLPEANTNVGQELARRACLRAVREGLTEWVAEGPANERNARGQVAAALPGLLNRGNSAIDFSQIAGGTQITALPDCLGSFVNLTKVICCRGQLRRLPASILHLKNLAHLDLSDNPLESLPEELGHCTNLSWLNLEGTRISHLPASMGRLVRLESLNLARTPLTDLEQVWHEGTVVTQPALLAGLVHLRILNLRGSQIGRLPESMDQWRSLEALDCSDTPLAALPDSFTRLSFLGELFLVNTLISSLPAGLDRLPRLKIVVLKGCRELRELPHPLGPPMFMRRLDLSETGLSQMPSWMGQMQTLRWLSLRNTPITTLPERIHGLRQLEFLDLSGTLISGRAPSWLFRSTRKELYLSETAIESVSVDPWDSGLSPLDRDLTTLDLSKTRLRSLPRLFGFLPRLSRLDLTGCQELVELPAPHPERWLSLQALSVGGCTALPMHHLIGLLEWADRWCPSQIGGIEREIGRHELLGQLLAWTFQSRALTAAVHQIQQSARRDLLEHWAADATFPLQIEVLTLREWRGGSVIDSLPAEIDAVKRVRQLDLRNCRIVHLPRTLLNLTHLAEINLEDPESFARLSARGILILLQYLAQRSRERRAGLVRIPRTDPHQSADMALFSRLEELQADADPAEVVSTALLDLPVERSPQAALAQGSDNRGGSPLLGQDLLEALIVHLVAHLSEEQPEHARMQKVRLRWLTNALWLVEGSSAIESALHRLPEQVMAQILVQGTALLSRHLTPRHPWLLESYMRSGAAHPASEISPLIDAFVLAAAREGCLAPLEGRLLESSFSYEARAFFLRECLEHGATLPAELIRRLITQTEWNRVEELQAWAPLLNAFVLRAWALEALSQQEVQGWSQQMRSLRQEWRDKGIVAPDMALLVEQMKTTLPASLYLWETLESGKRASQAAMRIQWAMDQQSATEQERLALAVERSLFEPIGFEGEEEFMPFYGFSLRTPNGTITLQDLGERNPTPEQMASFFEAVERVPDRLNFALTHRWMVQEQSAFGPASEWRSQFNLLDSARQKLLALAFLGRANAMPAMPMEGVPCIDIIPALRIAEGDIRAILRHWKCMRLPGEDGRKRAHACLKRLFESLERLWTVRDEGLADRELIDLDLWDAEVELGLLLAARLILARHEAMTDQELRAFSWPLSEARRDLQLVRQGLEHREQLTLLSSEHKAWCDALALGDVAAILSPEIGRFEWPNDLLIAGLLRLLTIPAQRWAAAESLARVLTLWQTPFLNHDGRLWKPVSVVAQIFGFLLRENSEVASILATVLRQIPVILNSPWRQLREEARRLEPATFQRAVISQENGPCAHRTWLEEQLRTDLVNTSPIHWREIDQRFQVDLESLYIDPVVVLGDVPEDWDGIEENETALQRTQRIWDSPMPGGESPDLSETWRKLEILVNNPATPRGQRDPSLFKRAWLKQLYRLGAAPSVNSETRLSMRNALDSGIADLDEKICSAGWNQVLSAIEKSVGTVSDFRTLVAYRLGTSISERAVLLFGTMMQTPEDAHLKNKTIMSLHLFPSQRSIAGASIQKIEAAWRDPYPLQDNEEVAWPILARDVHAPRVAADQLPPNTTAYDSRVLHLFRQELPYVLAPHEVVDRFGELLLELPSSSEGLDCNDALRVLVESVYGPDCLIEMDENAMGLMDRLRGSLDAIRSFPAHEQPLRVRPVALAFGVILGILQLRQEPTAAAAQSPQ
jgi:Leucine-rich repeat (LRR) protein